MKMTPVHVYWFSFGEEGPDGQTQDIELLFRHPPTKEDCEIAIRDSLSQTILTLEELEKEVAEILAQWNTKHIFSTKIYENDNGVSL